MEKAEFETVQRIAKRATQIAWPGDLVYRAQVHWMQDVMVVHEKTPLRLKQLLSFSNENFVHDMAGIAFHLNRARGVLEDQFIPRSTMTH